MTDPRKKIKWQETPAPVVQSVEEKIDGEVERVNVQLEFFWTNKVVTISLSKKQFDELFENVT